MEAFEQSWIPVPNVKRLFHTLMWGRSVVVLGVLSLATFLLLQAWARVGRLKRLGLEVEPSKSGARQLLGLGMLLLLLPFTLSWVVSQLGTSCFLERYLLPSGFGWAIILSYLIHHTQLYFDAWVKARSALPMRWSRGKAFALVGLMAVLLCLAVALPSKRVAQVMSQIKTLKADDPEMRRPDLAIDRLARTNGIPDDVPIVCTFIHRYNPVFFYSKKPSRYFFILDQDYIKTKEGRVGTTDYLLMSALERNYPEQNVLSWNEFASTRQRFAVLDDQQSPWTQYRLGSKSEFDVSEVFSDEAANMRLLLATRKR